MSGYKKVLAIILSITMTIGIIPMFYVLRASAETPTNELKSSYRSGSDNRQSMITDRGFIKADGKKLRTAEGKEIVLRGTNAGGYLLQEIWMTLTKETDNIKCQKHIIEKLKERFPDKYETLLTLYEDKYWTEADFDNCSEMGMNVIRLPFWYMNLLDENYQLRDNAFDRIDWFVEQAGKRGIYVILDMHGVPGSQNGQDHSGDTTQGVSFFQGSEAETNQQIAIDLWKKIAEHYNNNPIVAGYDLLNEPYTSERLQITTKTVWDYYDKAYKAIRQIDSNHLIIMVGTWEPARLPNPKEYGWENIMYEYHSYNYDSEFSANDQLASINKKLSNIDNANYNVPSYIGETSFFSNMESWRLCLERLNDYGISWTTWTYKTTNKGSSWGIYNQTTSEANIEIDSYEAIYQKWSKADQSSKNEELYSILKEYFNVESDIDETGEGRYEFEKADSFPNGGTIKNIDTGTNKFSKNAYVEEMNENSSSSIDTSKYALFKVNVKQKGSYRIMVGYSTTTDTKFGVQVNNEQWKYRNVSSTYAWDSVWQAPVDVKLNKGENIIKISGSVDNDSSWIILDYFDLTYLDGKNTTTPILTTPTPTTIIPTTITTTTTATKTSKAKAPKRVVIKKAKRKNKKISLKLKKIKKVRGYEIKVATNKKFKKSKKIVTTKISYTIKKVKSKKYYIKARAYSYHGNKKIYGKWSKVKVVK